MQTIKQTNVGLKHPEREAFLNLLQFDEGVRNAVADIMVTFIDGDRRTAKAVEEAKAKLQSKSLNPIAMIRLMDESTRQAEADGKEFMDLVVELIRTHFKHTAL